MRVAFLWHMHQPSYREADTGRYRYPWAFLHATRHYHMMGVLAKEHPEMAMTINVTPSLTEELRDYSGDEFKDKILDAVRKPADSLDGEEVRTLLDHAFKLNAATMIAPYPRYRELRNILEGSSSKRIRADELRDLQVWYLLTWTGEPLRREQAVADLFRKGKRFSEEDKQVLLTACLRAVREVLPLYRELQDRGKVELSTTPYYHPILPLLIDCEVARESRDNVQLEGISFRFPQDARWHVEEAKRSHEAVFGRAPRGMWPAEGGVSDAALDLLRSCDLDWSATDEAVLARSLARFPLSEEDRHQPYRFRENGVVVFFRDRELSDRIGFVYSSWNPRQAADDLSDRLLQIRSRLGRKSASACVSIVLDGENPWEYYPDSGVGFLKRLYERLTSTPGLEPVRMGDVAASDRKECPKLDHVVPGSWIDANFDTWIGRPEKNRAWTFLSTARQKVAMAAPQEKVPREFYRAEGSDWFWWLGPGHDTPYEASYEDLFRTNLLEGLARVGVEPPEALKKATPIVPSPRLQMPLHLFTPKIEGRLGNYYGWIAAGCYLSSEGSLHRSERLIERVRFGFDEKHLYLRAEGRLRSLDRTKGPVVLVLEFLRPKNMKIVGEEGKLRAFPRTNDGNHGKGGAPGAAAERVARELQGAVAVGSVAEAGIPLEELGARVGEAIDFAVTIQVGPDVVDRLPQSGYITVNVPPPDFGGENWSV